jgi:hypothetical protein
MHIPHSHNRRTGEQENGKQEDRRTGNQHQSPMLKFKVYMRTGDEGACSVGVWSWCGVRVPVEVTGTPVWVWWWS